MLQICIYVLANSNIVTLRIYQAYFSKSSSSYFISLIARILLHFMSVLLESSHLCMQKRGRTIQGDDIFIVISIYFYCTQKIFNKFKFGVANRLSSPFVYLQKRARHSISDCRPIQSRARYGSALWPNSHMAKRIVRTFFF